jgi:dihydroflavonol-4-reductase
VQQERRSGVSVGKVLVTGATGFTGGALARRLASEGTPVRALVRGGAARARPLAELGIEIAAGDLADPASLREALDGVSAVYHIAAVLVRA